MTLRRDGTSWRGPVQIRIWKVGPTPLAICQNKPPMSTSSFSLFSSSFPPPPLRHFQFRGSIFAAAKKTACASLRKKEFCQQSYLRTKERGKAFDHVILGGFVFRIKKELDWERSVFQILRIFTTVFRAVANEVCRALLIENKKE